MSRPAIVALVVLVAVLGAWAFVVAVVHPPGLNLASRRVLAVVVGGPVLAVAALAWLTIGRRAAPRRLPVIIEALPAIGVALAPLVGIIAIGIASGQSGISPVIFVALAAIYPGLAAYIAPRSSAELAVVGVAVAAPGFVLAVRLLMEPITASSMGGQPDLWHGFIVRVSLPVFVLLATFLAIEVASAAMRRAGELWVVAGAAMGAVTFWAGGVLSVVLWTLIDPPHM